MKGLIDFLKKPPIWLMLVVYLLTLLLSVFSIALAIKPPQNNVLVILSYIIYALAAIFLAYSIYTIVKCASKIKGFFVRQLKKSSLGKRVLDEYDFRTTFFAIFSFIINIAYVALNVVLGIMARSIWYGGLAVYYIILTLMRGRTIISRNVEKSFTIVAVALIILPLFLSGIILQIVRDNSAFIYKDLTIYAFAAYAFYKITLAILNIAKSRNTALKTRALQAIALHDALVSMLALQSALLYTFSDGSLAYLNAVTGAVVCAITITIGILMLIRKNKNERK